MTAIDALADLAHAQRLIDAIDTPTLPAAYLRDAIHLRVLEAVTRAVGRDPFPAAGTVGRLTGIPIYLDPARSWFGNRPGDPM